MRVLRNIISHRAYSTARFERPKPATRNGESSAFITVNEDCKSEGSFPKTWQNVAVKDNIATGELPTSCASRILGTRYRSPFEAGVISNTLERARNTRIVGKTNMDEFGMGSHSVNSAFGRVVRGDDSGTIHSIPIDELRDNSLELVSPGGSSGGSAVAVEEGLAHSALGTDTGGSVRLPAAYTGTVGFKPSYGLVSRLGVIPYANSLDTVGFMALSVATVTDAFQKAAQHDPRDPTSLSLTDRSSFHMSARSNFKQASQTLDESHDLGLLKSITVGFPVEYNIEELDPSIREAWQETLRLLRTNGVKVVPVSLPNTKHALSAYYVLAPAEAASNLAKYDGVRYGSRTTTTNTSDGSGDVLYADARNSGFGAEVRDRIILGSYTLSSTAIDNYFIKAQKVRRLVQRDFDRIFKMPNPLRPAGQFDIDDLHDSIPLQDKLGPAQVDFIVCPTAPTHAPLIQDVEEQTAIDSYMNDVFTVPASLAGLPAISIPHGSPGRHATVAGIQIIGQFGSDFRVLELAKHLEQLWEQDR